jgi:hypothetical protein
MGQKKMSGAAVKTVVLGDFDYGFLCMVRSLARLATQHW